MEDLKIKVDKFKWSTKYPYYKNKCLRFTIGIIIFSLWILYESTKYDDVGIWIIIIIGIYGLYYGIKNLMRIYNKEEISIVDDFFIVKYNGKVKSKTNIKDIYMHEGILWWKWNHESNKLFFNKKISKRIPFYSYETVYLSKEDEKIFSTKILVGDNDAARK